MLPDARDGVLRPGLDVPKGPALEQDRENVTAEPAAKILRVDRAAEDLRDRDEQVFAAEWTDLFFDLAEPVRPHVRELAHAAPLLRLVALRVQLVLAAAVLDDRHRVSVHGLHYT